MDGRTPLGTIGAIWRYPVKALQAEPLDAAELGMEGLTGDRTSALFVRSTGHARAGKPYRGKENNLLHTTRSVARAEDLAAERDVALERHDAGPYFDLEPVSIVFDRWLAELEAALATTLDPLRFRPNFYVLAEPGFDRSEADLVDARLQLGTCTLEVCAPITRCVTPSYDVETGAPDLHVARAVAERGKNVMGIYCRVAVPGRAERGEPLLLLG